MVVVSMEVLVHVGEFPINRCYKCVVRSWGNKDVPERYGTIVFGIFLAELDVGVNRVGVLEELVTMFTLLDDEGVIHIPKPESGCMGDGADGFSFRLFHE